MRPLTDQVPKPLLEAGGKPLIVHHIERLVAAGFGEFQPLDAEKTEDAFRRNRRIELKLTER